MTAKGGTKNVGPMRLIINENEEISLDGNPLRCVTGYRIKHDAGEDAELQITLTVIVDGVTSETTQESRKEGAWEGQSRSACTLREKT